MKKGWFDNLSNLLLQFLEFLLIFVMVLVLFFGHELTSEVRDIGLLTLIMFSIQIYREVKK